MGRYNSLVKAFWLTIVWGRPLERPLQHRPCLYVWSSAHVLSPPLMSLKKGDMREG